LLRQVWANPLPMASSKRSKARGRSSMFSGRREDRLGEPLLLPRQGVGSTWNTRDSCFRIPRLSSRRRVQRHWSVNLPSSTACSRHGDYVGRMEKVDHGGGVSRFALPRGEIKVDDVKRWRSCWSKDQRRRCELIIRAAAQEQSFTKHGWYASRRSHRGHRIPVPRGRLQPAKRRPAPAHYCSISDASAVVSDVLRAG